MNTINIYRKWYYSDTTVGELHITDVGFICYTLEDTVRPFGIKIPKQTAIHEGTYRFTTSLSNRFNRDMIEILGVPFFTGIRIHGGNNHEDTEGCICIAYQRSKNKIWDTAEHDERLPFSGIINIKNIPNI